MDTLWATLLLPIVVATAVYWASQGAQAWVAARRAARSETGHTMDQLRRDRLADRDALLDRVMPRLSALEARVEVLERELRDAEDYIDQLQAHIWAGQPPPPPQRKTAA